MVASVLLLIVGIGAAAFVAGIGSHSAIKASEPEVTLQSAHMPAPPSLTLNNVIYTLTDAQAIASFLRAPTYLPRGTVLKEVIFNPRFDTFVLWYVNPNLPRLRYQEEVQLTIAFKREPSSPVPGVLEYNRNAPAQFTYPVTVTFPNGTTVTRTATAYQAKVTAISLTVNGVEAVAFAPSNIVPGLRQHGTLTWWKDGITYTIQAELPVAELIRIAQSMGT